MLRSHCEWCPEDKSTELGRRRLGEVTDELVRQVGGGVDGEEPGGVEPSSHVAAAFGVSAASRAAGMAAPAPAPRRGGANAVAAQQHVPPSVGIPNYIDLNNPDVILVSAASSRSSTVGNCFRLSPPDAVARRTATRR